MRLLHTRTLTLYEVSPNAIPPYAILSHTWGESEEEVKLQDLGAPGVERKAGYAKIKGCCRQAQKDGLDYAWVDTCCIDKTSSAELSEKLSIQCSDGMQAQKSAILTWSTFCLVWTQTALSVSGQANGSLEDGHVRS